MRKTMLLLLLGVGFLVKGQLSIYASEYTGSNIGLLTAPYSNNKFVFSLYYGGQLGYEFGDRGELKVFVNKGQAQKEEWIGPAQGISSSIQWGISPQVRVFRIDEDRLDLTIALPISELKEDIYWSTPNNGRPNASGRDIAKFTSVALALRARLKFKKVKIVLEHGFDVSTYYLQYSHRTVYENEIVDSNFQNQSLEFSKYSITFHTSLGYYFW